MKFKKNDKVVMFDCMESKGENYGKIWNCSCDSFKRSESKSEVVFLDGFSGSFLCKYLQLVMVK